MKPSILIVDDDRENLESTANFLRTLEYRCEVAACPKEAIRMAQNSASDFAVVIMDYRMPEMNGAEAAERIRQAQPNIQIIMYSGDMSREALKDSWSVGALKFVEKDSQPRVLVERVEEALKYYVPKMPSHLSTEMRKFQSTTGIVGNSPGIAEVIRRIYQYRNAPQPVLILGSTGTGKDLVARALVRPNSKYTPINCATFIGNSHLLEAECFGYVKGAFTGADRNKVGLFVEAGDGTIFLDELHQLELNAQAKLLRVLEDRKVRPMGGSDQIAIRARIVAAAKPELLQIVEQGRFLPDLLYRLNILQIDVPDLDERPEDIVQLIEAIAKEKCGIVPGTEVFTSQAMDFLKQHSWPGNVRELSNFVQKLIASNPTLPVTRERIVLASDCKLSEIGTYSAFRRKLELDERAFLTKTLERFSFNQLQVAKALKVKPTSLASRLKRLGVRVRSNSSAKLET